MVLLREQIGDSLRHRRQSQGRTLRQVSQEARVSLGYLSEVERGQKEASSELLAAICGALDMRLSELLMDVTTHVELGEMRDRMTSLPATGVTSAAPTAAVGTVVAA